jgi:hypothetical protein
VLNAVPLRATASSKATAFSLIMVMVRFPCSVVFRVGPDDQGGRGSVRAKHDIETAAQFSILSEIENNSSPQSKNAIIGAAQVPSRAA